MPSFADDSPLDRRLNLFDTTLLVIGGIGTGIVISDDGGVTWSPAGYIPEVEVLPPVTIPLPVPVLLTLGVNGIYRSTDGGQNWTTVVNVQANRNRIGYVDTIAYDPRDPSVAYVSASGGVLKSTDAGSTWTLLTSGLNSGGCCLGSIISVDPFRPGRLYYSLESRVYRSADSGLTWTPIPVPDGLRNPRVVPDPVIMDAAYMYSYEGVYRSTDAGVSWQRLPLPPTKYVSWIVPHPSLAGRVYARTGEALLRSDDAGMTWHPLSAPGVDPQYAGTTLAVHPGKPDYVVVSGTSNSGIPASLYSNDGGQTWQPLGANRWFSDGFSFDPARPSRIYAAGPTTADAFVAKLNPAGEIVYLTYLGGQGADSGTAIAVGTDGSVYVGGTSQSTDFPGANLRLYSGSAPALFAAKLDPAGGLVFVALLGSAGSRDAVTGVATDPAGRLYLAGIYRQPFTNFVARIASNGTALEYSASLHNSPVSITVNDAGQAIISGAGVITRLDTSGNVAIEKPFPAVPARIASDHSGNVYGVAAAEVSAGLPITVDAFQKTIDYNCPNNSGGLFTRPSTQRPAWMTDAYIFKLGPDLSTLGFATYLGGSCRDLPTDLAVSPDGSLWVAGITYSDPFPSVDPIAGPPPPERAVPFVAHVDSTGEHLLFSSYSGTSLADRVAQVPAIATGPSGSVYIAGNSPLNSFYGYSGPALLWKISPAASVAQFTIRRVASAYGQSNYGIAPVDIVEIDVPGLVPQEIDLGLSPPGGPPVVLEGLSVEFNGVPAQMLAVHPDQVFCITPTDLAGALFADVRVKSGGLTSSQFQVPVLVRDLAFFPQVRNQDGTLNSPDNPAPAGSTVSLFVTGVGASADAHLQIRVAFGTDIDVTPAPIPGFISGIYEIRITAPVAGTFPVYLIDPGLVPLYLPPPPISMSVR